MLLAALFDEEGGREWQETANGEKFEWGASPATAGCESALQCTA